MQMMTGNTCLSTYGTLCEEVLKEIPQQTRIQILTDVE